jgi:ammonia channel protein AmtB
MIFKFYKNHCERTFQPTNLTMLTTGTLIIFITGLFINGGAGGPSLENKYAGPNAIVMNTVISSATSGLTYMLANQYSNLRMDNTLIQ